MRRNDINHTPILRWLLATICIVALYPSANGQNFTADTIDVNIFNRYDTHLIDSTYMGNVDVFLMLDSIMRDTVVINHTKSINVVSSSSIEGRESYNRALSKRRMQTIEAALRSRYAYIDENMWNFSYVAENWSHLRRAVAEDSLVPNQERVLSIIDMEERHPDTREYLLKILDDGVPWSYIHQHILPSSRGSVSMLFTPISSTPIARLTPIPTQSLELPIVEQPASTSTPPAYSHPIMSVRSNLLLDLSSTINIAVEFPIAPRWSISAEYINPWWKSWNHDLTWQIESLYFDLRYWLSPRSRHNTLTGWNVGVYAGSGRYDLQPFTNKGVQGEYSDFGATLSYAHTLGQSKHWLMEYTVGLGYLTTHYRHYYAADNTDEYGNIKVHNYPWSEETLGVPLPTRIGITLCYLINVDGLKRGGGRR